MTARLIDGKTLAQQVRERLAKESAELLGRTGIKPGLATILVGDDPASHLYVKNKQNLHRRPQASGQHDTSRVVGIDRENECRSENPRDSCAAPPPEAD